jgi:hypothetical protein
MDPTAKPNPLSEPTTDHSSSGKMDVLNLPKDPLVLGQHLVHELGLGDSTDTLGRWMAYHVAEQIQLVDQAPTEEARYALQLAAIETILKIWEHRTVLPGNANPLGNFGNALEVLETLQPQKNPFTFGIHYREIKIEQIAGNLYNDMSRLILMLLLKEPLSHYPITVNETALNNLGEDERTAFNALQYWLGVLIQRNEGENEVDDEPTEMLDEKDIASHELTVNSLVLSLIDDIEGHLARLRTVLTGQSDVE